MREEEEGSSSYGRLLELGIGFGIVHVITGVDHLGALATLAANGTWRAFIYGVRWGVGHSSGLLIIAGIFYGVGRTFELEQVEKYTEWLVAAFMLLLGGYGMIMAVRQYQIDKEMGEKDGIEADIVTDPLLSAEVETGEEENKEAAVADEKSKKRGSSLKQGILSCFIGLIHGLAGPGGILGILPAIHQSEFSKTALYLATFCISSTLTMGVFASLYGIITAWCSSISTSNPAFQKFVVALISAGFSVIIGVLFVILLALGIFDQIFE